MAMPFEKELDIARSIAIRSGALALRMQASGVNAEEKSDLSPVTLADRECEKLIAHLLEESFPQDGLLGEEGANKVSRNGRRWIIDPIDGTRDFVRGLPLWSVLIGLEVDGVVETGVTYLAPRGEMFFATRGNGAFRDDSPIHISSVASASQAVLCINGLNNMGNRGFAPSLFRGCLSSGRCEAWVVALMR